MGYALVSSGQVVFAGRSPGELAQYLRDTDGVNMSLPEDPLGLVVGTYSVLPVIYVSGVPVNMQGTGTYEFIVNGSVVERHEVAVALPLVDIKQKARKQIIEERNAIITGGFSYMGKTIDSDRDSVMSITGAAVAALAAKATAQPYSVEWTCADDSTVTLDADGVLGMAVALAMFADAQHSHARPLKAAIESAPDEATVEAVTW